MSKYVVFLKIALFVSLLYLLPLGFAWIITSPPGLIFGTAQDEDLQDVSGELSCFYFEGNVVDIDTVRKAGKTYIGVSLSFDSIALCSAYSGCSMCRRAYDSTYNKNGIIYQYCVMESSEVDLLSTVSKGDFVYGDCASDELVVVNSEGEVKMSVQSIPCARY